MVDSHADDSLYAACAWADLAVEWPPHRDDGQAVAVDCLTGERIGTASQTWDWMRAHPERRGDR